MSDQIDRFAELDQLALRGDWQELLARSRAAVAAHPDAWEPAYHEGRALLETGAYEQANRQLLLCMDRFPTLPQFPVLYGFVGARSLERPDAVARWESLQARMPHAPGLRVGLATAYRNAGQIERAEQVLATGLERMPHHVPMLIQYADLAAQRQDWLVAAQRWAVVRQKAPGRLDAAVAHVAALRQAGQLDEASALADEVLQQAPDDADLNAAAAAVAAARQDWAKAVACLHRVLHAAPDNLPAATGLVAALQHQGQLDEAEAAIEAALAVHPQNEVLLFERARMASRAKRWVDAVERWKRVHERCPPRKAMYLAYTEALLELEMPIEAEEIASEAIGFDPGDRDLLMQHAELATKRFDSMESQKRWMALRRKFPEDEEIMEGVKRARKMQMKETIQLRKDDAAAGRAVVRGTMKAPERPDGPAHMPSAGPTALDLLKTGVPVAPASSPAPAPTGVSGLMKKLFGRR